MNSLPLFPTTTVGSWPRPKALLRAQRAKRRGRLSEDDYDRLADDAVLDVLRLQEEAGVNIVTDGEQRRDNFYSFVAEKLVGVELMTLGEMLDVVEDKTSFERILKALDVPADSISSPTCVGTVGRARPLAADELRFLKRHTDKPMKVTLPGPYLLTRAMYVPELTRRIYATKEDLAEDVVRVLIDEAKELVQEGVDFIQFDEPVLSELVFGQGRTRTFMCAALAAREDPAEELEFAVSLINRVVGDIDGVRTGLHVCRGNWSRDESTLLRGGYRPLAGYLERLNVDQLVLEYATDRAGDVMSFYGKELGLGVVNPRTESVESPREIEEAVGRALEVYAAEKVFLNPDCGFGTFSRRPVNSSKTAFLKLQAMTEAAASLR